VKADRGTDEGVVSAVESSILSANKLQHSSADWQMNLSLDPSPVDAVNVSCIHTIE